MSDEEYVRANWEKAYSYQSLSGVPFVQFGAHSLETWAAAAEFTLDRLEQIRQLREEIVIVREQSYLPIPEHPAYSRILSRLQAELAKLTAGMKP